jgi:hypothetical protein
MKILKHQNGHFVPKHEDVTANDVYRALKRFSLTLDQFTAGMGQHPEAEPEKGAGLTAPPQPSKGDKRWQYQT